MGAGLRLVQIELRAAYQHFDAVIEEDLEQAPKWEHARHAVDQRQELDTERGLQRCVFVEAVERLLRLRAALEFDDDAHPALVRFVAQVADLVQAAARARAAAMRSSRLVLLSW